MQYALDNIEFGQMNAVVKKLGGKEGVERFLRGELVVTDPANLTAKPRLRSSTSKKVLADLLELEGDPIRLPAVDRFVARDKFVVDRNGELPISYLGHNFKANFLGKTEEKVKKATLKRRKLLKSSLDAPILDALGGEKKAEVALAHAFEFLKTADRDRWYIFYVRDANGNLWAVRAYWDDRGWDVSAYSVSCPDGWDDGYRVVSPR